MIFPATRRRGRQEHCCSTLLYVLLMMFTVAPQLQAQPEKDVPVPLAGKWTVRYMDILLGPVTGEAVIGEDEQSATVTLRHPDNGRSYTLQASSIVRDDDAVTITLEGESPGWGLQDGLDYPEEPVLIDESSRQIEVQHGDSKAQAPVNPRAPSDLNRLVLELQLSGQDHLSGRWYYRADAVTFSDTDGYGRQGDIIYVEGQTIAHGHEHWRRAKPVIRGIITLEDQLDSDRGFTAYEYPFGSRPLNVGRQRYLFIFGENLPTESSDRVHISHDETGFIHYGNPSKMEGRAGNSHTNDLFERGFSKLLASVEEDERERASKFDALIIRADLKPGVKPGYHVFKLNGVEKGWLLQFGDNQARIGFTRAIRQATGEPRYEWTRDLFLPETVQLEVKTNIELPAEEIALMVAVDGEVVNLSGGSSIIASRVPGQARVFRTRPLTLKRGEAGTANSDYTLLVSPNSVVSASVASPGLISIDPPVASATVWLNPGEVPVAESTAQVPDIPPGTARWRDYVQSAYSCDDDRETLDWHRVEYEKSDEISSYAVLALERLTTRIDIGDHAAMIYLRQTFIGMLEKKDRDLARINDSLSIAAFRRYIEPYVWSSSYPIGDFEVDGRTGGRILFAETFLSDSVKQAGRRPDPQQQAWIERTTLDAINQLRAELAKAREFAAETDICDVEELLGLTGVGFDRIAELGASRLMRLEDDATRELQWIPHYPARGFLTRLPIHWDTNKIHEDLAAYDSDMLLLSTAVISIPVIMYGGSAGVVAGVLVDVLDITVTSYREVSDAYNKDVEVEFALQASQVLGEDRLRYAEAIDTSWTRATATILLAGTGILLGADDFVKVYRSFDIPQYMKRIGRGRKLADTIESGEFRHLEPEQKQDLLAFASNAQAKRSTIGIVDELEESALDALDDLQSLDDALDDAFTSPGPAWKSHLDEATWERLEPMLHRVDLLQLLEEAAPYVQRVLNEADGDKVFELIRYAPHRSQEELSKSVEAMRKRITEPQGEQFYKQADPEDYDATFELKGAGWFFETTEAVTTRNHKMKFTGPNLASGDAFRSFDEANGIFGMDSIFRKKAPSKIEGGLKHPLLPDGSTPSVLFVNLRFMNTFGIGYAGRGGKLMKQVKVEHVVNPRAAIQLEWMRRTYLPDKTFIEAVEDGSLNEFARHCFSVQYAETAINMAGYRIKNVRIEYDKALLDVEDPVKGFEGTYKGREPWQHFIERHNLKPDDHTTSMFDIFIEVEPF